MEKIRKPFQGISNIIRFNWHFYAIAFVFIFSIQLLSNHINYAVSIALQIVSILISMIILISLIVSYYVYDISGFYNFDWIKSDDNPISIINISAGFDETSSIIKNKYKKSDLLALDFYNPKEHTEISIKRARKLYPPYPETIKINAAKINLENNSFDKIFVILSAHEIRNKEERICFFSELKRIVKPKGQIIVTEHLRDIPNFIAYNVGAFHFYSKSSWLNTFRISELNIISEIKNTPFISTFTLETNGNTL